MDTFLALLPQHQGLLPKWLLFVSITAFLNSIQAYTTVHFVQQVYLGPASSSSTDSLATDPAASKPAIAYPSSASSVAPNSPVTALSSRTFGTWTFLSSVIRFYAAYHISDPLVYQLAIWSYALAWAHFMSEWWVFGSARMGKGLLGPVLVSTGSMVWMLAQWNWYTL